MRRRPLRCGLPRHLRRASGLLVGTALAVCLAAACAFGDADLASLEPDAVPLHPTWEDVQPVMETYCTVCHSDHALITARSTPWLNDQGSTEANACRVRYTMIVSRNMPPGVFDHPTSEDRLIVDRWASDLLGGQVDCAWGD